MPVLWGLLRTPQVSQIEHAGFVAAQPERVNGLEQGGVPHGRHGAFAAPGPGLLDPPVNRIEQGLHFVICQWSPPWPPFVIGNVGHPVVFVEDLLGVSPNRSRQTSSQP